MVVCKLGSTSLIHDLFVQITCPTMDSCPILLTFSRVLQLEVQVDVHGLDSSVAGHDVS